MTKEAFRPVDYICALVLVCLFILWGLGHNGNVHTLTFFIVSSYLGVSVSSEQKAYIRKLLKR